MPSGIRAPPRHMAAPNEVWSADFKGPFKTGDGRYCYPLTITDNNSRFLLGCEALSSTRVQEAKPVFTRVFKEFGLPQRIRTDNGVSFATNTLARLSQLSVKSSIMSVRTRHSTCTPSLPAMNRIFPPALSRLSCITLEEH
jgi:transposase InsO family protein